MIDQLRETLFQIGILLRFHPGSHHVGAHFLKAVQDPFYLLCCLALAVDRLSVTVTKLSVMVQICVAQILIGKLL